MSSPTATRFEGRVAVVTGGASGIGAAIARRIVAERGLVAIGDVNEEKLASMASELGDRVVPVVCDVRQEKDIELLVSTAVDRFGQLNLGFNVAGLGSGAAIEDQLEEQWDLTVDVCLKGVFFSMKHEARQMIAQGIGGAIVNVASLNSRVPMFGGSAYCAAKAGAAMLGECGALEWAERGIRVNTVSPGLTATPLTSGVTSMPGVTEAYMDRIPMKRVGQPEDMAAASLFLASEDASYISGTNLFVDGAWATSGYPDLRPALAALAASR